jgi:phosphatidylglycerophosphate synthase
LSTDAVRSISPSAVRDVPPVACDHAERLRDSRYPVARWYLRPAAAWLATLLAGSPVRPVHLTVLGLAAAGGAATALLWQPQAGLLSAGLVLLWWFCDRADGLLARRQGTASRYGAWLDANVDELVDVGLHVAIAAALAARSAAGWPWLLLVAFLAGKYLTMYGLQLEEAVSPTRSMGPRPVETHERSMGPRPVETHERSMGPRPVETHERSMGPRPVETHERSMGPRPVETHEHGPGAHATGGDGSNPRRALLRALYHLPGNADVRAHLLVLALATGYLAAGMVLVALYYNLRWIARHALVARRLGGGR